MAELHIPVMIEEVLSYLDCSRKGVYVDATLGDGGHALGIYRQLQAGSHLIGIDWDEQVFEEVRKRLRGYPARVTLVHSSYTRLEEVLAGLGIEKISGLLLDLGVSTRQLSSESRGFSYHGECRLDMRMDCRLERTAEDLVNELSEKELADLIFRYGEERFSRRIARNIVDVRAKSGPIRTNDQLVNIIKSAVPSAGRREKHPARRTFQALRIAVNQELGNVERVLPQAVNSLEPGGRLCVISYHSLEDRLVKRYFREMSRDCRCPPDRPCVCQGVAELDLLTPRAIKPANEEIRSNPRARSARLRVVAKKDVLKAKAGE